MDRRTALQSLSCGMSLVLAGCTSRETVTTTASSEGSPTTSTQTTDASSATVDVQDHTVTVTKQIEQGQRDLKRSLQIKEGGQLESTLTCADGTSKTATTEISAERWNEFERLVLRTDVSRFASEYQCSGECPQDLPQTRLTVRIDGESTVVRIEPAAEVPEALNSILSDVESFEDHLDAMACD